MMNWTIKEISGPVKQMNEMGARELTRTLLNQGIDEVCFKIEGARFDGMRELEPESVVEIFRGEKRWFYGLVTQVPGYGRRGVEGQQYRLSGPWWYLENLVYQQGWKEVKPMGDEAFEERQIDTGRVILGQGSDGKAISNGSQVVEVLEYAIKQGAPIAIGEVTPDVTFPYDETKDISCAEAIKRLLRWTPDAVVYFDYSTAPYPTVHVKRRGELERVELGELALSDVVVTPREDLKVKGVVLKYEKTHTRNGQSWTSTDVDAYPKTVTGREFKTLVMTVTLDGSRVQQVSQRVKVAPLEIQNAQWWREHVPSLARVPVSSLRIEGVTRKGSLGNELLEGSVAGWMGCRAETDTIRARVSYETESERVENQWVSVKVQTTDAVTKQYLSTREVLDAETTPRGLAKALYEGASVLGYEGRAIWEREDVDEEGIMGKCVGVFGDGEALVQRVEERVDTGRTIVWFGPAKHLGPDDMVELLRVNRRRRASRNAARRVTGKTRGVGVIEQPEHGRLENSDSGGGELRRLVIGDGDGKFVLDGKQAVRGVMELREEDVCENGVLKKRLVLASSAYEEGGAS